MSIEKKKQIINYLVKVYNKLDPSGENAKRIKKQLEPMSLTAFNEYMTLMRDGKNPVYLVMPNQMRSIKIDNIMDCADMVGVKLFHRLRLTDKATGVKYLTKYAYPVMQTSVRRLQQFQKKKESVSEGDTRVDKLTGQVTGPDRSSQLSGPEIQSLKTRGLDKTLSETVPIRGGNVRAYGEFRRQLEETGKVKIEEIQVNSRARSAVVANLFFEAMHIDSNL